MKIFLQIILMFGGTIGVILSLATLTFYGPRLLENKKRPFLWIFSLIGAFFVSTLCIFISFSCFNSVTEENWTKTINIATDTVKIHQNEKKIEIAKKTDGVLKTELISYEGEIEDIHNSQKDKLYNKLVISAKKMKQKSLIRDLNKEYLTDVKIENAHE